MSYGQNTGRHGLSSRNHVYYSKFDHGFILSEGANPTVKILCERLWFDFFKMPLDTLNKDWKIVLVRLRKYFFECGWFEVYDFTEFVANNFPFSGRESFVRACNTALEKEVSAYRFVNGMITKITDQVEIGEIDRALENARDPVRTHLRRALELAFRQGVSGLPEFDKGVDLCG